jgi:predicted PurR-regulated permease PerM
MAPGILKLCARAHIGTGALVGIVLSILIGAIGLFLYYAIPPLISDVQVSITKLPTAVPALKEYVLEHLPTFIREAIPNDIKSNESLIKFAKDAGKIILHGAYGGAVNSIHVVGHIVLSLVLGAFLITGWETNAKSVQKLVTHFAQHQVASLSTFVQKFQQHGVEMFKALGIVALIFMPVMFGLLYFYGELPFAKAFALGVILGVTSAIPTIGGIFTYILLIFIGIANYGVSHDGIQTIIVMYCFALVMHVLETKFITPRVLGHKLGATSFYILFMLIVSVLIFGIGFGIFAGLLSIILFRAITETSIEYVEIQNRSTAKRKTRRRKQKGSSAVKI